jgi:hypothetical protein
MAVVQVVIAQSGPLPIKATAQINTNGPAVLTLAGSVWATSANQMIGVSLVIDGEPAEVSAAIYSNGASTHRAVVPATVEETFDIGSHTFTLVPMNCQTTSDANDHFSLTVQY